MKYPFGGIYYKRHMDYNIKNGQYYKVINRQTNELITFGEITEGQVLSTIHKVFFITEDEYNELSETRP